MSSARCRARDVGGRCALEYFALWRRPRRGLGRDPRWARPVLACRSSHRDGGRAGCAPIWPPRRRRWRSGTGVAVLRDGAPGSGGGWALVAAGAVAVATPLWVKSRRELRQELETRSAEALAIETDAKLRLVVGDVVTPIAEVVGRVHQTSGREREALGGQLRQLAVEAAASLCDGERARAIFWKLERGEMRASAWFGRGDPPTTVFTDDPGDRRGQEALLLVRFHDYLLVDDVRAEELPRGRSRGREPPTGRSSASRCSAASRTWACCRWTRPSRTPSTRPT